VLVCVLTVGTRGDVHPFVALGAGLRAAGHEVALPTSPRFASSGLWEIERHRRRRDGWSDKVISHVVLAMRAHAAHGASRDVWNS
jgi:hypothetical protein